jgi:hypothetical protein
VSVQESAVMKCARQAARLASHFVRLMYTVRDHCRTKKGYHDRARISFLQR